MGRKSSAASKPQWIHPQAHGHEKIYLFFLLSYRVLQEKKRDFLTPILTAHSKTDKLRLLVQ